MQCLARSPGRFSASPWGLTPWPQLMLPEASVPFSSILTPALALNSRSSWDRSTYFFFRIFQGLQTSADLHGKEQSNRFHLIHSSLMSIIWKFKMTVSNMLPLTFFFSLSFVEQFSEEENYRPRNIVMLQEWSAYTGNLKVDNIGV